MVKIKVCGIKCPNIAYNTAIIGVKYIGIMCHKGSKRYIDIDIAQKVSHMAKQGGATPIAIFVDHEADEICEIINKLGIDHVQLHGDIARKQIDLLPKKISIIYALCVDKFGNILENYHSLKKHLKTNKDFLLFDGETPGSGNRIVTTKVKEQARDFKYFIAGGINLNNISDIIKIDMPYGVDLSSGAENNQGNKDINIIKELVSKVNKGDIIC